MAKHNWERIRNDFEIKGLSAYALSKKHNVSQSVITYHQKKEGWNKEKIGLQIAEKVKAEQKVIDIDFEIRSDHPKRSNLILKEAEERLELEGFFKNATKYNQTIANKLFKDKEDATLFDANMHSQITQRNKDSLLGKNPDTQVNIQNNNNSTSQGTIIDRIKQSVEQL